MTSKTFQPLLYDNFLYKLPNTTYEEHYSARGKKNFSNLSKYSSLSQREKMAFLQKRARPFTTTGAFKNEVDKQPHLKFINTNYFNNKSRVSLDSSFFFNQPRPP